MTPVRRARVAPVSDVRASRAGVIQSNSTKTLGPKAATGGSRAGALVPQVSQIQKSQEHGEPDLAWRTFHPEHELAVHVFAGDEEVVPCRRDLLVIGSLRQPAII